MRATVGVAVHGARVVPFEKGVELGSTDPKCRGGADLVPAEECQRSRDEFAFDLGQGRTRKNREGRWRAPT